MCLGAAGALRCITYDNVSWVAVSHERQGKGWKLAHELSNVTAAEDEEANASGRDEMWSPICSDKRASSRLSLGGASIEPLCQKAGTCGVAVRENVNVSYNASYDSASFASPTVAVLTPNNRNRGVV